MPQGCPLSDPSWGLNFGSLIPIMNVTSSHIFTQASWTDPLDWSMPGCPVHHQPPELIQTHVHWISDAIQPSHSLLSPSPPTFNFSQHQSLFKWVSSSKLDGQSIGVSASTISPSKKYSGLISFRMDWLRTPWSPRDSQESSPTPQFWSINSSVFSFLYSPTLTS